MAQAALTIDGLSVDFEGFKAVNQVNMIVDEGELTGLEAAQGRKEEAVTRHFRWSCVAQSLVQRVPASGSNSDRCAFAQGEDAVGQRVRTIARDALHGLLKLGEQLFAQGRSCTQILEGLMPA